MNQKLCDHCGKEAAVINYHENKNGTVRDEAAQASGSCPTAWLCHCCWQTRRPQLPALERGIISMW